MDTLPIREAVAPHLGKVLTPELAARIVADAQVPVLTELEALTLEHLGGNADAAAFVGMLCDVLHVCDDLVDQDKALSDRDITAAFRAALVLIPANPFFHAYRLDLLPLIDQCFLSWVSATHMERTGGEEAKRIAFVVRSDYINVFLRSVQIVRGFDYACAVAPAIRAHWHGEGWDGYLTALETEESTRSRHGMQPL